eukprot:scaffold143951_cov16-Prasinocladus_malaysianus.AAC.1
MQRAIYCRALGLDHVPSQPSIYCMRMQVALGVAAHVTGYLARGMLSLSAGVQPFGSRLPLRSYLPPRGSLGLSSRALAGASWR